MGRLRINVFYTNIAESGRYACFFYVCNAVVTFFSKCFESSLTIWFNLARVS